jgi:hypothetical protein
MDWTPVAVTARHQLRAPPADFTGRVEELDDLLKRIGSAGVTISALHGQGGIGKTALALKLAEALRPRYPDAQIDIDLKGASAAPLSPADVMAHVIRAYLPNEKLPEGESIELRDACDLTNPLHPAGPVRAQSGSNETRGSRHIASRQSPEARPGLGQGDRRALRLSPYRTRPRG